MSKPMFTKCKCHLSLNSAEALAGFDAALAPALPRLSMWFFRAEFRKQEKAASVLNRA